MTHPGEWRFLPFDELHAERFRTSTSAFGDISNPTVDSREQGTSIGPRFALRPNLDAPNLLEFSQVVANDNNSDVEVRPWYKRVRTLACLFVLIVGLIYSIQLRRDRRFQDERDYNRIGYSIYHQGVFSTNFHRPTAYRAPGYPAVLGLVLTMGKLGIARRMVNYIMLCGTFLLGYRFLKRRGRPHAANLAVMLSAVYPLFLYTASTMYPQTMGALLLAVIVNLLPEGRRLGIGRGVALGLASGAMALTIPTFLAGIGLLYLWLLFRGRTQALAGVLVAGLVMTTCISGWTLRNYSVFDAFIPISTNAGRNLLLGNSENTTASSGVNVDVTRYEEMAEGLDEVERDHFYRESAVTWIREHPGEFAKLYCLKLLNHFNVINVYATDEEVGLVESIVLSLFYVPLLAVFLWRLTRLRKEPFFQTEAALYILYFGMAMATAIFFTRIRFRLPLDHMLIWAAAAYVTRNRDRSTASEEDVLPSSEPTLIHLSSQ